MFLCLREGCISISPIYQDLEKVLQTLKLPGKVLEFCFDQRGRTPSIPFHGLRRGGGGAIAAKVAANV